MAPGARGRGLVPTCALMLWVALVPARAAAQTETIEYYGLDALGSVRVVFTPAGSLVGRMDYGPFGDELYSGLFLPDQRFAALMRDGEAGLDYAQARSYQVRTGRFNAPDPVYAGLFEPQRWNRYAYAFDNPLTYIDPTGLLGECKANKNGFRFCGGTEQSRGRTISVTIVGPPRCHRRGMLVVQ